MAESLQRQLFRLQFNLANILRDLALFQDARTVDEAVLGGKKKKKEKITSLFKIISHFLNFSLFFLFFFSPINQ